MSAQDLARREAWIQAQINDIIAGPNGGQAELAELLLAAGVRDDATAGDIAQAAAQARRAAQNAAEQNQAQQNQAQHNGAFNGGYQANGGQIQGGQGQQ